jgi:4-aminobutyrate aminotransferase/(S)-3-amino-2-methylpropionate transaminase
VFIGPRVRVGLVVGNAPQPTFFNHERDDIMSALKTLLRGSGPASTRAVAAISHPAMASRRCFSTTPRTLSSFYPNWEPDGPTVKTEIPGPKSREIIADLDKVFDTRSLNMLTDYSKSTGNDIADPDDNVLLDV